MASIEIYNQIKYKKDCPVCGRRLSIPVWKYCNNRECYREYQKLFNKENKNETKK